MNKVIFVSDATSGTILFRSLEDYIFDGEIYHATTLSEVINELKDNPASEIRIILSDNWINDLTDHDPEYLKDFIYAKEKISLFIDESSCNVKWGFFMEMKFYKGNKVAFREYCEQNQVELYDNKTNFYDCIVNFMES